MSKYTLKFPPEMNNKKYSKQLNEREDYITIPLEGEFKKKNKNNKEDIIK